MIQPDDRFLIILGCGQINKSTQALFLFYWATNIRR